MNIESKNIEDPNEIAAKFANEVRRADLAYSGEPTLTSDYQPLTLERYIQLLKEYLPHKNNTELIDQYFSDDILQKELEYIDQDAKLAEHYPSGYILQLCPIPFSTLGNKLSVDDINDGVYLKKLILSPDSKKTISGFSASPSNIHKMLPKELNTASFKIPQYSNSFSGTVTEQERAILKSTFTKAFKQLKETLKNELQSN